MRRLVYVENLGKKKIETTLIPEIIHGAPSDTFWLAVDKRLAELRRCISLLVRAAERRRRKTAAAAGAGALAGGIFVYSRKKGRVVFIPADKVDWSKLKVTWGGFRNQLTHVWRNQNIDHKAISSNFTFAPKNTSARALKDLTRAMSVAPEATGCVGRVLAASVNPKSSALLANGVGWGHWYAEKLRQIGTSGKLFKSGGTELKPHVTLQGELKRVLGSDVKFMFFEHEKDITRLTRLKVPRGANSLDVLKALDDTVKAAGRPKVVFEARGGDALRWIKLGADWWIPPGGKAGLTPLNIVEHTDVLDKVSSHLATMEHTPKLYGLAETPKVLKELGTDRILDEARKVFAKSKTPYEFYKGIAERFGSDIAERVFNPARLKGPKFRLCLDFNNPVVKAALRRI